MPLPLSPTIRRQIEAIYRNESRRVLATLIRVLGDFEQAEEALHEAFRAAMEQWPENGIPDNPRSWLISAGRFKAIDRIRRRASFNEKLTEIVIHLEQNEPDPHEWEDEIIADDILRLIFTCCHPALAPDARTALTLREVCGLTTEEIAHAYLTSPSTMAQRIVRAKRKIRDAGIPYEVPSHDELPDRLESVLQVIYLVFNEGYSPSFGDSVTRADISGEAIRLGRLLHGLMPDVEVAGLLALMLLHESRRDARTDDSGDIVLLADQDRSRWNQALIQEGVELVDRTLSEGEVGMYLIQAAISAVHASAQTAETTDWPRIVSLYDLLLQIDESPIVELNRAVAVAMADGPESGLVLIDDILNRQLLIDYHLLHSARGHFLAELDRIDAAREAYETALSLTQQEPEKRLIESRLREIGQKPRITTD